MIQVGLMPSDTGEAGGKRTGQSSSAFRDLSKDVGAQIGSQTIQMNSQSEGVEQFALGALQDAYRSTTPVSYTHLDVYKRQLIY